MAKNKIPLHKKLRIYNLFLFHPDNKSFVNIGTFLEKVSIFLNQHFPNKVFQKIQINSSLHPFFPETLIPFMFSHGTIKGHLLEVGRQSI